MLDFIPDIAKYATVGVSVVGTAVGVGVAKKYWNKIRNTAVEWVDVYNKIKEVREDKKLTQAESKELIEEVGEALDASLWIFGRWIKKDE